MWLILAIFIGLGCWYAVALPIFEAADEISHFRVIEFIAAEKSLPHIIDDGETVGHESGQPPLYYALLAPLIGLTDRTDFDQVLRENPHFGHLNSNSVWYHQSGESDRWQGTVLAVRLGRIASLFMGAFTVWCVWATASTILPEHGQALPLLSAGLVAFNPQFLAVSGSINNDNLVIALCSFALLLLVRWRLQDQIKPALAVGLGVVVGLAVLAKISALAFGLVIGCVLLVRLIRGERFWSVIQTGLWLTAGFLATAGWWFWRNQTLYGDPLGLDALSIAHAGTYRAVALTAAETLAESQLLLKTFWLFPGNGTFFGPTWFYWVINLLITTALAGWLFSAVNNRHSPARSSTLYPLLIWTLLIIALLFYWISTVGATSQGRLLYPAISAMAILVTAGFYAWGTVGRWLAWGSVGFLAIFALLTPSLVIRPAFSPPQILTADFDYPNEPVAISPEIELLGYEVLTPNVSIGDRPEIRLFWQASAPLPNSQYVTLHFVDSAGTEVSRYEGYPAGGKWPTVLWQPGDPFSETIMLPPIQPNGAAGLATIWVELTGWKGTPSTAQQPLEQKVKVRLEDDLPLGDFPADATFGTLAKLTSFSLNQSESELDVTLHWEVIEPNGTPLTVFVHLLDENGALAAQGDGVPRGNSYPTNVWEAGEAIPDRHIVPLEGVQPGNYTLAAGFYDPTTGNRLPTTPADFLVGVEIR